MSPCRKRKTCSADDIDELMAEFRRLRDETQPINNNLMALSPLRNPLIDQSGGQLLRELQLMRTEMRQTQNEMKESLALIRGEVAEVKQNLEVVRNDQQVLKRNQKELGRNQDSVKGSQEFVKSCVREVKTTQMDLKKAVTDDAANLDILKTKIESVTAKIDKMTEKVPETNYLPAIKAQLPENSLINNEVPKPIFPPTFKERISGKWKYNGEKHVSLKLFNEKLVLKWGTERKYVYTFGVGHSNGWTVNLEGEKIVQLRFGSRRELYLQNGELVCMEIVAGKAGEMTFFENDGCLDAGFSSGLYY